MFCLLLLMSFSILIGSSIQKSAEKELDRLKKSMASGFILKADTDNELYQGAGKYGIVYNGPRISEEMIGKIVSLDGIEDYMVEVWDVVYTDLNLRPGAYTAAEPDPEPDMNAPLPYTEEHLALHRHTTYMYPCRNGELHKNFRTGALSIEYGRNIEEGDRGKAVISDWLAKENHLSVGDTITLEIKEGSCEPTSNPLKTWGNPVKAEIVGLFRVNFSQASSDATSEACYIENIIYTDMDTSDKMQEAFVGHPYYEDAMEYHNQYVTVEFLVEDPAQIDAIIQQMKELPDLDLTNMELEIDDTAYRASARPYRQIRVFAMLLLALGLCGMGIVLFLTLKLWMQGRKKEIAVLYSIGMKKRGIRHQMLAECLLVSAVALALAFLLSGSVIDRCANVAERLTAPKKDVQEYEVKITQYFTPEVIKTSSAEAVLEREISRGIMFFTMLFVCGISCASVLLSFAGISDKELKKWLQ